MSASRSVLPGARAAARTRTGGPALRSAGRARFQSSSSSAESSESGNSHLVAGLAGGGLVLVGGYAWYYLSGTSKVVSTARDTLNTAEKAKERVAQASPSPRAALGLLRSAAHSYATAIPGAGPALDKTFDQLEAIADEHGERVAVIIKQTYADVRDAVEHGDAKETGDRVLGAIQKGMGEIQKLGGDVGGSLFKPLLDKQPELKKALGGGADELQKLADKYGPDARKIAEDTQKQLKDLVNQGLNGDTLRKASDLVQQRTREIYELASKSSSDAWSAAARGAQPLLNKLPDVRETIEKNVDSLKGVVGEDRVRIVKELYGKLEELAKSGKGADEVKAEAEKIVKDKVGDLQSLKDKAAGAASGSGLEDAIKSIPGLDKVFTDLPDLKDLKQIAQARGPEAQKVLESTAEEFKKVLQKKLEEAKGVADKAKEDAKKD